MNTYPGFTPAWKKLLLTGILLAACASSASSKPQTEGAREHLPAPRALNGVLTKTQPAASIPPKGHPAPVHTSQEVLHTAGSLVNRKMAAQDSESHRPTRRATEQIPVKSNPSLRPLLTFPAASQGMIYSDLNFSVILTWLTTMTPEPVLSWTLDGKLCGTGEKLFIRRLSPQQLGTYICIAKNTKEQLVSEPVTISLPQVTVAPTDMSPIEPPDPALYLSGGSAIGLVVAACVGGLILMGAAWYYVGSSLKD